MNEETTPAPKQYLLMADELNMALLARLMPGIRYVEVQGMVMTDNAAFNLLVTPVPKIVEAPSTVEAVLDSCECPHNTDV